MRLSQYRFGILDPAFTVVQSEFGELWSTRYWLTSDYSRNMRYKVRLRENVAVAVAIVVVANSNAIRITIDVDGLR